MNEKFDEFSVIELEERVEFGLCGGGGGGGDDPGDGGTRCDDVTWPECHAQ